MEKKLSVAALVVAVVALGIVYFTPASVKEVIRERIGATTQSTSEINCTGLYCVAIKSGTCQDATSTIFAVKNPFSASSTISVDGGVLIQGFSGSTSPVILVGTSSTGFINTLTNLASPTIISSSSLVASEFFTLVSGNAPGSRINYSQTSGGFDSTASFRNSDVGNIVAYSNATSSQVVIGPSEWVVGQATSTAGANNVLDLRGVTGVGGGDANTFSCNWAVEFRGFQK